MTYVILGSQRQMESVLLPSPDPFWLAHDALREIILLDITEELKLWSRIKMKNEKVKIKSRRSGQPSVDPFDPAKVDRTKGPWEQISKLELILVLSLRGAKGPGLYWSSRIINLCDRIKMPGRKNSRLQCQKVRSERLSLLRNLYVNLQGLCQALSERAFV